MKWKVILEKMIHGKSETKEGIIKVLFSSIEDVMDTFKRYGWNCTYAVPVSDTDMVEDEDTVFIDLGGKP